MIKGNNKKIYISKHSKYHGEYDISEIPNRMLNTVIIGIEHGSSYQYIKDRLPELKEEFYKRIKTELKIYKPGERILLNWNNYRNPRDFVGVYEIEAINYIHWDEDNKVSKASYEMRFIFNGKKSSKLKSYDTRLLEELKAVRISDKADMEMINDLYT